MNSRYLAQRTPAMRPESERSQVSRKAGEGTVRVRSLRSSREVAYSEGAAADGVLADIRKEYRLPESTTDGMTSSSPPTSWNRRRFCTSDRTSKWANDASWSDFRTRSRQASSLAKSGAFMAP
jgi:hypothetical protein